MPYVTTDYSFDLSGAGKLRIFKGLMRPNHVGGHWTLRHIVRLLVSSFHGWCLMAYQAPSAAYFIVQQVPQSSFTHCTLEDLWSLNQDFPHIWPFSDVAHSRRFCGILLEFERIRAVGGANTLCRCPLLHLLNVLANVNSLHLYFKDILFLLYKSDSYRFPPPPPSMLQQLIHWQPRAPPGALLNPSGLLWVWERPQQEVSGGCIPSV